MFIINKVIDIKLGVISESIDMLILKKTEEYLTQKIRQPIQLFNVNYKELKPKQLPLELKAKPGHRYFKVIEAFNQRDK